MACLPFFWGPAGTKNASDAKDPARLLHHILNATKIRQNLKTQAVSLLYLLAVFDLFLRRLLGVRLHVLYVILCVML